MTKRTMLLTIALAVVSLLTACGQISSPPKCSMNMNQLPDLRGFKLGMPLEQIWERFPDMPKKVDSPGIVFSVGRIYTSEPGRGTVESQKPIEIYSSGEIRVNVLRYPDLQGIDKIYLRIMDNKVASIEIYYESTQDRLFMSQLPAKLKESLKLDGEWTDAPEEKERREHLWNNLSYDGSHFKSVEVSQISCNGFIIYAGANEDLDVNKVKRREEPDTTYDPFVKLIDTEAINKPIIREEEEKKKRQAVQEAEEKRRREEFKP